MDQERKYFLAFMVLSAMLSNAQLLSDASDEATIHKKSKEEIFAKKAVDQYIVMEKEIQSRLLK